jgi:hypothetical protein
MAKKLTPWFPADQKPVRRGVYETKFEGHTGYSRWTGSRWANQRPDAVMAQAAPRVGAFQTKRWRGLAEKPE